jgi:hypothetical protein
MTIFTKNILSSSTDGRGIKIAATSTPGTTIHTGPSSTTSVDEIWLYAYNSSTGPVLLTVQYGGTATPDDDIKITIPSQSGLTLIVPGLILAGTGSAGNTVAAYAALTNVITISGYVNRIS